MNKKQYAVDVGGDCDFYGKYTNKQLQGFKNFKKYFFTKKYYRWYSWNYHIDFNNPNLINYDKAINKLSKLFKISKESADILITNCFYFKSKHHTIKIDKKTLINNNPSDFLKMETFYNKSYFYNRINHISKYIIANNYKIMVVINNLKKHTPILLNDSKQFKKNAFNNSKKNILNDYKDDKESRINKVYNYIYNNNN